MVLMGGEFFTRPAVAVVEVDNEIPNFPAK